METARAQIAVLISNSMGTINLSLVGLALGWFYINLPTSFTRMPNTHGGSLTVLMTFPFRVSTLFCSGFGYV
jgi:hypothetical protein